MSIYLKDNSMILNTPETVDTVVAPVMPYTSLIMAGNESLWADKIVGNWEGWKWSF
ncbi:hypothetical protein [Klebsiella oxytoca]|uniref:hypothetical protein n=1 Tax=Klebsiella oxytoca TaxID=571 RepID=UPI0029D5908E|nr:hypothetical protein [Klebsiella oxytoca]MDX7091764.1 hypothetical protein [Klebsiella oxytoca]